MDKKIRAPLEQLIAAGKEARRLLRKRGIEAKDSVLDTILKTEGAPTLPGIPVYLPQPSTILAAQRILYNILLLWREECGEDEERINQIKPFFVFLQAELNELVEKFSKEEQAMPELIKSLKEVPVLKYVFGPTRNRENTAAMHRFLVDGLATLLSKNSEPEKVTVEEFANWFLDWSQDLYDLWVEPKKRKHYEDPK